MNAQKHSGSKKVLLPVLASACHDLRAFKALGRMTAGLDLTGFPSLDPVFIKCVETETALDTHTRVY